MKRGMVVTFSVLLLCVSLASADLVIQRPREEKQKIMGQTVRSHTDTFVAQKRALAIASGLGSTCLGMYVFDEHGNCVAWDDVTAPQSSDDLAADWIPHETARFDVQIRNAGFESNTYNIALR